MYTANQTKSVLRIWIAASIVLAVVAVFIVDYFSGSSVEWGLVYLVPIAVCGIFRSEKLVWWLALFCCGLVIAGFCLPVLPEASKLWVACANRVLALVAIATTAILVQGKIRALNESVLTKKLLSGQIEKTNRMAKTAAKANHELDQFIYLASHDLHEPLRMVAGYTLLLQRQYDGELDEKANLFISNIVDGTKRMQGLINDLWQVSRAGIVKDQNEEVELSSLVEDAKANLVNLINKNNATVTCNKSVAIKVNVSQMMLVFQYTIENAIKYRSEAVPVVVIDVDDTREILTITIRDNGIGIEDSQWAAVFQVFQRLNPDGNIQGRGIGLTMAQRIVENHCGKIWLDSRLDEGTTVYIQFS
jgi:signal transduction histidine kinase